MKILNWIFTLSAFALTVYGSYLTYNEVTELRSHIRELNSKVHHQDLLIKQTQRNMDKFAEEVNEAYQIHENDLTIIRLKLQLGFR